MTRRLIVLGVLCLLHFPIFAQTLQGANYQPVRRQSLSLSDYLKSKYIGTTVTYERKDKSKKAKKLVSDAPSYPTLFGGAQNESQEEYDNNSTGPNSDEVREIVILKDGYQLMLGSGERLNVLFEINQEGNFEASQRLAKQRRDLEVQRLKTEEFLNLALTRVGNAEAQSSGPLLSGQYAELNESTSQDFTSGEEIIYTDRRTSQKKKGFVFVSPNGLFLETGSAVNIVLEVHHD